MAEGEGAGSASAAAPQSPGLEVDFDPEFEPQSRPRSCTWPLQRPDLQPGSPAPTGGSTGGDSCEPGGGIHTMIPEEEDDEELLEEDVAVRLPRLPQLGEAAGSALSASAAAAAPSSLPSADLGATPRKCSSRRNAWGNLSYADLITRAIESSPEKRLALSQIYEWMVRCVPYFKDKGDSNSSAGWKVQYHKIVHSGTCGPPVFLSISFLVERDMGKSCFHRFRPTRLIVQQLGRDAMALLL